jgi:hypothetical protein
MAAGELRAVSRDQQENAPNPAPLAPLVEALAVRLAAVEGELAVSKAALRAHLIECDGALDAARGRLGQARNVEQRCKKLLEQMRMLVAKHT